MKNMKRKKKSLRIIFSFLVIFVAIGLVLVIQRGIELKEHWSRLRKENRVEEALNSNQPSLLGKAVIIEYELTGEHSILTNKCAKRISELKSTQAAKALRNLIDLRWEHRDLAYKLIGLVGDLDDAAYLARVFEENPSEREECIKCFVQILSRHNSVLSGNDDMSKFLSKILQDKRFQESILKAIAMYPNKGFSTYIEDLIERRRLFFKSEAILAYLELNAPYSELITSSLFNMATGKERHNAAVAAVRNGSEHAVRWLALVMTDPTTTSKQKRNAEEYLTILEARHGLAACITEYEIDRVDARVRAVEVAGKISGMAKIEFLEKALKDPAFLVRLAAIRALGNEYNPKAVQLLIGILNEDNEPPKDNTTDWREASICITAAALGKMGAQEAVPVLAGLLWYAQPVRSVVYEALVRITMEDFGADPAGYIKWYEEITGQSHETDNETIESSR